MTPIPHCAIIRSGSFCRGVFQNARRHLVLKFMNKNLLAPFSLKDALETLECVQKSGAWLENPSGTWSIGQATGSSRALLTAILWHRSARNMLLLTKDQNTMYSWLDDLQFFCDYLDLGKKEWILPFPHPETLPYEVKEPDPAVQSERLTALRELVFPSASGNRIIVAPIRTILRRFAPPDFWRKQARSLRVGDTLDRDDLVSWLSLEGYEFRELVCAPGEYSVRGGILDVFPLDSPYPLRLELFGNELDSIRVFDLVTQRSTSRLDSHLLLAANEDQLALQAFESGIPLESLLEEATRDYSIVIDELPDLEVEGARFISLVSKMYREAGKLREDEPPGFQTVPLIPPEQRYLDWEHFQAAVKNRSFMTLSEFATPLESQSEVNLGAQSLALPSGTHKHKLSRIMEWAVSGQSVWIICDNEGQKHRLEELLQSDSMIQDTKNHFTLDIGALHKGFILPALNWVWTTDREIFGRYRTIRQRMAKGIGMPIVDLVDLKPGDYVVHVDHGIARYRGLKSLEIENRSGEFLILEYADEDLLYVPIEQIERVGRYIGSSAQAPKLNKLGGKGWQSAKARARQAIEDMAGELLELYAERSIHTGHSFKKDTPWQHEFEASFLFEETPDQIRSIDEVKRDMESPHPMDRLICGDVGFGKTEVALRAAFKAVMEGKQAAVLVPTTVLAEQHYRTFSERMADYPVKVEVLSRFRTAAEQREAVERLAEGKVDVVIGTHRLLQKDVKFRDLGLVIIDEEQRFGVRHKERLKQMRTLVDCLTLTATPIPRTLYMSLNGVRDMSIVNTPPKDRLPIQTYVCDWSHEVIESAILREMARGGQIYFVHNRVQSIGGIAALLHKIVPEARVVVAHGQMAERELARVMREFIDHQYDILLSTTIIESGLDIPSVNTIIINRADAFGLAELYQLRGRVGRDRHRAYCYLLVPSRGALSRIAKQRLLAIQEFNQLGSGFQLALRDMEIRGMGNLLGREQHGYIASIGFDLYSRLLAEAVDNLTGKQRHTYPEPQIDLALGGPGGKGEISPSYVPSARLRMSLYKRLAGLHTREEVDNFEQELSDLYGMPPQETRNLIDSQRLLLLAWEAGIDQIRIGAEKAILRYCEEAARSHFSPELVIELDRNVEGRLTVSIKEGVVLTLRPDNNPKRSLLEQVQNLLQHILRHAQGKGHS